MERNFSVKGGEVDIIAKDKNDLVFIEVKARRKDFGYSPLEAVTPKKINRIGKAALMYVKKNFKEDPPQIRFDAAAVSETEDGEKIEYVENAFCPHGYFF